MATNADFDALIVRIDTATNTLENSVDAVANGASDIEDSVVLAQQAATTATQQAQAATDLVTQLEASVVLEEAPEDGQQYARQDGAWTVVEGGGGEGTVTSVNSIAPDGEGNVTLSASDVGAKPSSYIPTWSEVTGKPTTFAPIVGTAANQAMPGNTVIPTNTNQLTNGAGFITAADVPVQSVNGRTGAITLVASDIPALPTSKITTGVFNPDRLGSSYNSANPHVLVPDNASGAKWAPVPSQAASFITSGTFDTARLGSGTASASTYLRGDGTWAGVTASGPNYTATFAQEAAIGGIINRLADAATNTLATVISQLAGAGFEYGGVCVINLQANAANPGGYSGTAIVQVIPRKNASTGATQEIRFVVEYASGTGVGKKYFTNKYQDAAASWVAIDATA